MVGAHSNTIKNDMTLDGFMLLTGPNMAGEHTSRHSLFICLFVCLFVCLSVSLSVCLFVCLSPGLCRGLSSGLPGVASLLVCMPTVVGGRGELI
jgi:hypothetical protein